MQRVGVPLEVDGGAGHAAANVNELLGKAGRERQVHGNGDWSAVRLDGPPAIKLLASTQGHGIGRSNHVDLERPNQIEHGRKAVRPDLQQDVAGIAEHPEIERAGLKLIQFPVPRDRHVIGLAQPAGG